MQIGDRRHLAHLIISVTTSTTVSFVTTQLATALSLELLRRQICASRSSVSAPVLLPQPHRMCPLDPTSGLRMMGLVYCWTVRLSHGGTHHINVRPPRENVVE